jgi:hypothetical protein
LCVVGLSVAEQRDRAEANGKVLRRCIFLLLMTGCFFGDSIVHSTVSLSLQVPQEQTNMTFSVSDAQVQGALKLIDGTLASNGFVRDTNPLAAEDQARGIISLYGICSVSLKDNKLDVGFLETNKRHFSASVRKTIGQLKEALSNRYGADRVTTE